WSFPIAGFHFGRSDATDPDLGATPDPDVALKSDYIQTSPDDCSAQTDRTCRGRSTRSKYLWRFKSELLPNALYGRGARERRATRRASGLVLLDLAPATSRLDDELAGRAD